MNIIKEELDSMDSLSDVEHICIKHENDIRKSEDEEESCDLSTIKVKLKDAEAHEICQYSDEEVASIKEDFVSSDKFNIQNNKLCCCGRTCDTDCVYFNSTSTSLKARFIKRKRKCIVLKRYVCEVCNKVFSSNDQLKDHFRCHTGEKPFRCNVCGKAFSKNCNLKRHGRIHTGEKNFICKLCEKGFSENGHLIAHIRTHTGEKLNKYAYECNVCKKVFGNTGHLADHTRTHTGEKPYRCKVCQKDFSRSGNLARHLRSHTGDKPYKCQICKRGFSKNKYLGKHACNYNV